MVVSVPVVAVVTVGGVVSVTRVSVSLTVAPGVAAGRQQAGELLELATQLPDQ